MKKTIIMMNLLAFFLTMAKAQNMVPNPDFETFSACPAFQSELYRATPWFQPSWGTPDYFNSCNTILVNVPSNFWGYQNARSGVGYAGFFSCMVPEDTTLLYREYCEVKLNSSLQAGVEYFFTMYVSLGDSMRFATDAIGAYFSVDTVKNNNGNFLSGIIPQIINAPGNFLVDKIGWTKIFGKFTASGGESFLTIGNFKEPIFTDTVSVAGGATNIFQPDYHGGYYYLDDICVSTDSIFCDTWSGIISTQVWTFDIGPNPVNEVMTIDNVMSYKTFTMIDLLGEVVVAQQLVNGLNKIETSSIAAGMYLVFFDDEFCKKIIVQH